MTDETTSSNAWRKTVTELGVAFDYEELWKALYYRFENLESSLRSMDERLKSMEARLSRFEGVEKYDLQEFTPNMRSVLKMLMRAYPNAVPGEDMKHEIWRGRHISKNSLYVLLSKLRERGIFVHQRRGWGYYIDDATMCQLTQK
jgi:hypothetical protein